LVAVLLLGGSGAHAGDGTGVVFPEPAFDFGRVVRGDLVEHGRVVQLLGLDHVQPECARPDCDRRRR